MSLVRTGKDKAMTMTQIDYYLGLILQKLDLRGNGAVMRIEAIYAADWGRVEFLEQMMLKPLDAQISYLAGKLHDLLTK